MIKEPVIVDYGERVHPSARYRTYCPDCRDSVAKHVAARQEHGRIVYTCKCGCEYYGRQAVQRGK